MSESLLNYLPHIQAIVEKLGVVGILILGIVWLIYERRRLMMESKATFRERDMARMVSERYRTHMVANGIEPPNIADIELLFREVLVA